MFLFSLISRHFYVALNFSFSLPFSSFFIFALQTLLNFVISDESTMRYLVLCFSFLHIYSARVIWKTIFSSFSRRESASRRCTTLAHQTQYVCKIIDTVGFFSFSLSLRYGSFTVVEKQPKLDKYIYMHRKSLVVHSIRVHAQKPTSLLIFNSMHFHVYWNFSLKYNFIFSAVVSLSFQFYFFENSICTKLRLIRATENIVKLLNFQFENFMFCLFIFLSKTLNFIVLLQFHQCYRLQINWKVHIKAKMWH